MTGRLKVGDLIEVDGTVGKVQQISYTSTIIESLAGEVITFQNSQLFDKNYKNLTKNHGYVATPITFGVAYGSNLKQVQQLVDTAVNSMNNPWVDSSRPGSSIVTMMNDSSVDFKIIVWAEALKRPIVTSEVLRVIYDVLGENGIEIPFPQRDIHIISPQA
jgi:small-conductance mechanosensitive channel